MSICTSIIYIRIWNSILPRATTCDLMAALLKHLFRGARPHVSIPVTHRRIESIAESLQILFEWSQFCRCSQLAKLTKWPYLSTTHFSLNFGGTKFCHGGKLRCTWQSHLSNFQQQPLAECITGIPYLSHQWTEVLTFANLEIICVLYTIENSGWPFEVPATYPPRYDAVRNPEFFWIQRHQKTMDPWDFVCDQLSTKEYTWTKPLFTCLMCIK